MHRRRLRTLSWVGVLVVASAAWGDEPYGGVADEGERAGRRAPCLRGGPDVLTEPACASPYDADGDGDVDLLDVAGWQATYAGPWVVETQLAGNALATYPYFTYVTAFNVNAPVQVGLDPTLFPELVGVTANLYVVADQTEAEWNADPTLVDVRPAARRR